MPVSMVSSGEIALFPWNAAPETNWPVPYTFLSTMRSYYIELFFEENVTIIPFAKWRKKKNLNNPRFKTCRGFVLSDWGLKFRHGITGWLPERGDWWAVEKVLPKHGRSVGLRTRIPGECGANEKMVGTKYRVAWGLSLDCCNLIQMKQGRVLFLEHTIAPRINPHKLQVASPFYWGWSQTPELK